MYQPKRYSETDRAALISFMQAHPFVTLIANDGERSYATQIPVIVEQRGDDTYIIGHVSIHTDHYPVLEQAKEVLTIFTGPHCYVSASWYNERGIASTWNYMTVQARGGIRIMDSDETLQVIKQLTDTYEGNQEQPELLENMPEAYVSANLKAIKGFEIKVTDMSGTFKLSQNKTDQSYVNVVNQLKAIGKEDELEIAEELMKRRPELFQ